MFDFVLLTCAIYFTFLNIGRLIRGTIVQSYHMWAMAATWAGLILRSIQ